MVIIEPVPGYHTDAHGTVLLQPSTIAELFLRAEHSGW
jgi:hypothetical protein